MARNITRNIFCEKYITYYKGVRFSLTVHIEGVVRDYKMCEQQFNNSPLYENFTKRLNSIRFNHY